MALAARLPQETDPTAHRMLHVLMKALLGRVGGPGRQKVLGLVLAWRQSPKRVLHAALAETLGLFVEVVIIIIVINVIIIVIVIHVMFYSCY